jgi:hypothetical protein
MVPKTVPTELQVLRTIYELYHEVYSDFDRNDEGRNRYTSNYVPIDITAVGRQLDADPHVVFGILYYVLDGKHGQEKFERDLGSEGTMVRVPFFLHSWPPHIAAALPPHFADERHLVHFPMVAAIYASLRDQNSKASLALWVSAISAAIAAASLLTTCSK